MLNSVVVPFVHQMTSSNAILGTEEPDLVQLVWDDFARLKVNSQNCWKIVNYHTVERIPSPFKDNKMKLDSFQDSIASDGSKENMELIASKAICISDSDDKKQAVSTATNLTLTSTNQASMSAIKKRTNRGYRVKFNEHVHHITTENENRPTQRSKSCTLYKTQERDHLPKLRENWSQSAKRKSNQSSPSSHDQTAVHKKVHVDGKSMRRANSNCSQVFQRFLPRGSMSDYADVDSAAIEIVRNYNDPSRGVYGGTSISDLYR